MTPPIFWSIDLDFWGYQRQTPEFPEHLIGRLLGAKIPMVVVSAHHQILPLVNAVEFATLLNTDYHSDLWRDDDARSEGIDASNWANGVVRRKDRTYIWNPPLDGGERVRGRGYCHGDSSDNPFRHKTATRWKRCMIRDGNLRVDLSQVSGCAIAISRDWLRGKFARDAYRFLHARGLSRNTHGVWMSRKGTEARNEKATSQNGDPQKEALCR